VNKSLLKISVKGLTNIFLGELLNLISF